MVAGYVVMRVPLVFLWWRPRARPGPPARRAPYMSTIAHRPGRLGRARCRRDCPSVRRSRSPSRWSRSRCVGPVVAERRGRHAVARAPHRRALRAARDHHPRRGDHRHCPALNAARARRGGLDRRRRRCSLAGVGLTFGCGGPTSSSRGPSRWPATASAAFVFGYGHIFIFGALAAMGGGPPRRGLPAGGRGDDRRHGAVLCVAIPVAFYVAYAVHALLALFRGTSTRSTSALLAGTARCRARGRARRRRRGRGGLPPRADAGARGPVVGYETLGHRHVEEALRRMRPTGSSRQAA